MKIKYFQENDGTFQQIIDIQMNRKCQLFLQLY